MTFSWLNPIIMMKYFLFPSDRQHELDKHKTQNIIVLLSSSPSAIKNYRKIHQLLNWKVVTECSWFLLDIFNKKLFKMIECWNFYNFSSNFRTVNL